MTQRDNILQELQELDSRLLNDSFANVYQVPAGYFDELPGLIMSRIRTMEAQNAREELAILSPLLNSIERVTPYQLPEGYFESLETSSPEPAIQEELEQLSPLLSGLKKQMPYQVPEGYFASLDYPGPAKKSPSKLISINHVWFKYAAAAVIIAFITVGGFLYLNKKTIDPNEQPYAWVKKNVDNVPTDELGQFVEGTDNEAPVVAVAGGTDEIKELMKNVSDKEIQDFLNDTEAIETISN